MRIGAAHALDVGDYHSDEQYVEIRHRPSTPLKNKEDGERLVALSPDTCAVLDDWIAHKRSEVTDDQTVFDDQRLAVLIPATRVVEGAEMDFLGLALIVRLVSLSLIVR